MDGFGEGGFGEGPFGSVRDTVEEVAPETPEEIIEILEEIEHDVQELKEDIDDQKRASQMWRWITVMLTLLTAFGDDLIVFLA